MNLEKLSKIAIRAARSAGEVIQKYMNADVKVAIKNNAGSYAAQVVTVVDKECEAVIISHLQPSSRAFDLALLTEETEDNGSRFKKEFFWCVDPMDGTLSFINKEPGFAVSIALVAKDGSPYLGVVYDPSRENLYHAIRGDGVYKNGIPFRMKRSNDHLSYFTDRKLSDTPRAGEIENLLDEKVENLNLNGRTEIPGAGAVMNAIHVLENGPACMLKLPKKESGGGSIWDYAATACIYNELCLQASNFEGAKLDLNRYDSTYMNHQGVFYANL